ncbi:acyl carrier protein [Pseudopelagicola sp. nBUS_19]|uniref:acyl carrier protein n=1 Tax=Pseudopelagicola sp. nBUS_19 TaxID=3395316 RepID=UPI003EB70E33
MSTERETLIKDLLTLVADEGMVEVSEIAPEKRLDELDIQSADFVMILMAIEEKYNVYISVDNELADVETVQDLIDLVVMKIKEEQAD